MLAVILFQIFAPIGLKSVDREGGCVLHNAHAMYSLTVLTGQSSVAIRMTPALRWAAMRAVSMFH